MADIDLSIYDSVATTESAAPYKMDDFSDFLRGLPYFQRATVNVDVIEFESGHEQRADNWCSKTKEGFTINLPISTKAEMLEIYAYWKLKGGSAKTFYFTSPFDAVTYTVRFALNTQPVERRHYGTWVAVVELTEVF